MAEMLALTLLRPWDAAVIFLGKDVENRKWHPAERVRGTRIALHAGQGWDEEGALFIRQRCPDIGEEYRRWLARIGESRGRHSVIVGTTRVDTWIALDDVEPTANRWAFGPWCWQLSDTFALPEPVPCKGALGLWKLPPDVSARVLAQEASR